MCCGSGNACVFPRGRARHLAPQVSVVQGATLLSGETKTSYTIPVSTTDAATNYYVVSPIYMAALRAAWDADCDCLECAGITSQPHDA